MHAVILRVCPNKGIFEGKLVGKNRPIRSSVALLRENQRMGQMGVCNMDAG